MMELLKLYFVQTGFGWVVIGAIVVVTVSCLGSAKGIWIASSQAAGVLSEKPELFGKDARAHGSSWYSGFLWLHWCYYDCPAYGCD